MSKLTLKSWISCVTVVVILLAVLLPSFMDVHGGWLSMVLILLLGIPHGATDHILFRQVRKDFDKGWLYRFFARYFLLMGLLIFSWWVLPALALIVFLAVSAYHFGQSEWHKLEVNNLTKFVLYSIWGGFVLAAPLLWNYNETAPIINSLIGYEVNISTESQRVIPVLFSCAIIFFTLALFLSKQIKTEPFFKSLFSLFLLNYLFFTTSLLVGFAVYFVFWHSLESMEEQILRLKESFKIYTPRKYFIQILPFTLIALVSIALFSVWSPHALMSDAWIGQFFMLISIVTLPHSLLMDAFLESPQHSKYVDDNAGRAVRNNPVFAKLKSNGIAEFHNRRTKVNRFDTSRTNS